MRHYLKYLLYLCVVLSVSGVRAGAYEDFFQAVNRDDGHTVSALLKRGFDPNARSPDGQTALHLALRDQSPRTADAVWASRDLDVDALNANGETPLMIAALRGDLAWVQRLLERGAQPHRQGWSPLHYAATGPNAKVVELLLARGAPVDALSPSLSTALMMAAGYGSEESVDILLARGADKRLKNDAGLDAAAFAARAGKAFLVDRLRP